MKVATVNPVYFVLYIFLFHIFKALCKRKYVSSFLLHTLRYLSIAVFLFHCV